MRGESPLGLDRTPGGTVYAGSAGMAATWERAAPPTTPSKIPVSAYCHTVLLATLAAFQLCVPSQPQQNVFIEGPICWDGIAERGPDAQ